MQITATIEDLKARLAGTASALAGLREKRRPVALKAMQGDAKAQKAVAALDAEEATVRSDALTAEMALEEAERLEREERARLAEEAKEQRRQEAAIAASELLDISEAIDRKAAELAELFGQRYELAYKIGRSGAIPSNLVNRLLRAEPADRAMMVAGLSGFISMPRGAAMHREPLAAADGKILAGLAIRSKPTKKAA